MAMYPRIPLQSIIANCLTLDETDFTNAFYYPDDSTRARFLDYFMLEYGMFTPIYTEPEYLLAHIQAVAASLKYTIDKLYATLSLEYNPIENYDRHENWTDTRTPDLTTTYEGGDTLTMAGGDTLTMAGGDTLTMAGGETEAREQHSIERQVSADNTGAYFPSEKTIEDPDTKTTTYNGRTDTRVYNERTDTREYNNRSDTRVYNDRADKQTGTDENEHEGRIHGNIGVTTSQQMIQSERYDVAYFNFIDEVARLYGEKLCILIY